MPKVVSNSWDSAAIRALTPWDQACMVYNVAPGTLVVEVATSDGPIQVEVASILQELAKTQPQMLRDALKTSG